MFAPGSDGWGARVRRHSQGETDIDGRRHRGDGVLRHDRQADWSGDGHADVLAIDPGERLLMYRGNGAGGWATGSGEPIGTGWGTFTAILSPGDFSGDNRPDLLVRRPDGRLLIYRGNGAGGFVTGMGEPIGAGWGSFGGLTLAAQWRPPPPPPAPPSAPLRDGRVRLSAGIRCTPPGGRLRVSLRVRRRPGRAAPRVRKVVFFTRGGPRRVDRRHPYVVRLRVNRPAGTRGASTRACRTAVTDRGGSGTRRSRAAS
jgi:FG-GAP-like repeat